VKPPKVEPHEVRAITPQDARAILEAVEDDSLAALWTLLLGSGMRLGEACALDWGDVDLAAGTVSIRRGKTKAARRTVPLPGFVVLALKAHHLRAGRPPKSAPVFTGDRNGTRLRADVATHRFPRLLERAGLRRMRVHDLRHGTATLLLARGVPMRTIADMLGHANPSITANVYAHVSAELRKGAAAELEEAMRGR
jgi:integrase